MQILIATHNQGKFKELMEVLHTLPHEFVSLKDLSITEDVEENGETNSLVNMRNSESVSESSVILKLERKGSKIVGSYSTDGKKFTEVASTDIALSNSKTGIIVCDGAENSRMGGFRMPRRQATNAIPEEQGDFEVSYDYFKIKNSGLK